MADLRPLLPADVDPATEMILSNDWGVRRDWLAYAAAAEACSAMVAVDAGGRIVATGVGTANGPVGWIGSIFVEPEARRHGLGRAITQAVIDALEDAGCTTLLLVSGSKVAQRIYEGMGFEVQTRYRILEAPGLPASSGGGATAGVRPFQPADLRAIATLDRDASGEDRRHALDAFANPTSTKVLATPDGEVRGYVCRAPWGGGATIARTIDDALAIADARRRAAGQGGKVRVGILRENDEGHARLIAAGWAPSWSAPRMIRGQMPEWHPERIWGQFNHAMG
ncbi:MAG TPA: GNAT family N-acetyltransferase [Candidatus Limnocylindrales bacterium]|nr:GNAT family N-acetyltransferase [Candidatus Limnocylindrales bacterium]